MPSPDWILVFRSFSPEELSAHITTLKGQMTLLSAQSIGDKSLTRDLGELRNQLSAAVFVQNERNMPLDDRGYGVSNFENVS